MPLRQRLTRWFLARLGGALPFRVRVEGELPTQPMLWVANHVSWTDIPLLGALQPLSFLSKAEVRAWPVAGWLAHKAGTLFIRRGSGDSSQVGQQLTRHLQQGRNLLIFPEGTTTDGLEMCIRDRVGVASGQQQAHLDTATGSTAQGTADFPGRQEVWRGQPHALLGATQRAQQREQDVAMPVSYTHLDVYKRQA